MCDMPIVDASVLVICAVVPPTGDVALIDEAVALHRSVGRAGQVILLHVRNL
jgi:hypothetical protein